MESLLLLSRNEMKMITGGNMDPENCMVTCDNCNNSSCRNVSVDDCSSGIYEVCGPGYAGSGPSGWCTCVDSDPGQN